MNCIQNECKYIDEDYKENYICTKNNIVILDKQIELFDKSEKENCKDFEQLKSCKDCKFSSIAIYESGVIDSEDYYCTLQDGKMIYSDISPYRHQNVDFPECNINKWKEE